MSVQEMIQDMQARAYIENKYEYHKWEKEIPFLKFKESWEVKILPPFGGAIIRFAVKKKETEWVSVYLDCYDNLGCMGKKPYWEIFPNKENTNERFWMDETNELLSAIQSALEA